MSMILVIILIMHSSTDIIYIYIYNFEMNFKADSFYVLIRVLGVCMNVSNIYNEELVIGNLSELYPCRENTRESSLL